MVFALVFEDCMSHLICNMSGLEEVVSCVSGSTIAYAPDMCHGLSHTLSLFESLKPLKMISTTPHRIWAKCEKIWMNYLMHVLICSPSSGGVVVPTNMEHPMYQYCPEFLRVACGRTGTFIVIHAPAQAPVSKFDRKRHAGLRK